MRNIQRKVQRSRRVMLQLGLFFFIVIPFHRHLHWRGCRRRGAPWGRSPWIVLVLPDKEQTSTFHRTNTHESKRSARGDAGRDSRGGCSERCRNWYHGRQGFGPSANLRGNFRAKGLAAT